MELVIDEPAAPASSEPSLDAVESPLVPLHCLLGNNLLGELRVAQEKYDSAVVTYKYAYRIYQNLFALKYRTDTERARVVNKAIHVLLKEESELKVLEINLFFASEALKMANIR